MINIQQNSFELNGLSDLLEKYGTSSVQVNSSLIKDDIEKMKKLLADAINKNDKRKIESVIEYLERLSKHCTKGTFEQCWSLKGNEIDIYPLGGLLHFPLYNIQATDYITIDKAKLIKANYRDLFELMAFEMMYRDLDFTFDDMEDRLKHIGVTAINDCRILLRIIGDESPLDLSKILRIGSSPYATVDGKLAWDYFGSCENAITSGKYSDCIGKSVKAGLSMLVKDIITKCLENKLNFKVCAVGENGLYFILEDADKLDISKIFDTAVIRVFGRKFEVKPQIVVF